MKQAFWVTLLGCLFTLSLRAQNNESGKYSNFPVVISVQFHSFSLPFRQIKTNFSNIGFGVGTEVSLNGKRNWVQQFSLVWYHNKTLGNGLLLYTQSVWRPYFNDEFYSEIKAGAGHLHSFRPVESFRQTNGNWVSAGHKGKGMFTIPVGVSLGHDRQTADVHIANFGSYQFLLVKNFNKTIPVVPETLIQAGTRIHF